MSQKIFELVIRKKTSKQITAVLATEYPVQRGYETEVLRITSDSVNRERFPLPVITQHETNQLPVGVAVNARVQNGELIADIMMGDSAEADAVYADIQSGVINSLSIGYQVDEKQADGDGKVTVTRFTPYEVSFVSVPADPNSRILKRSKPMTQTMNREEVTEILAIARRHNQIEMAEQAIERGESLTQFRSRLLDKIADKPLSLREVDAIGMSDKEVRQFSLARAIEAKASGDWSNAGLEAEVLRETSKRSKHGGLVVPTDLLKRDLVTTSPANGQNLIQTDVLGDAFIDALVQSSVVLEQCTVLTGNVGDISIPKMATSTSAAWYGETDQITESSPVISQISMSPRTVAGFTEVSRRMIQQASTDVEALLRRDMAAQIASAIDSVIIDGGGANQPSGVLQTNGIGSVALGTNGAAITYEALVNLVKEVSIDNALQGNLAFLTNPKVVASMRQTARQTSGVEGNFILNEVNSLLGYPVLSTNNVPSDLSKGSASGTLSSVIFGNWSDVIVGMWSGLELLVDPYSKAEYNLVRIRGLMDLDVAVRHPESFAAISDVVAS